MTDRAHMPAPEVAATIPGLLCYEDLIDAQDDQYTWPSFDENTASSLCYTSGTTGNPKGVLYSHRSTVLHTFAAALPDALNCSQRDAILPVVPMFHVNAWGLPYVGCMTGAKMVYPGPGLDGKSLYELFESEGVTLSAGVPTVWQGLLAYVEANKLQFSTMTRTVIGGSACPPAMIRVFNEKYGVHVLHAWGMTEMSPLGTASTFKAKHLNQSQEERYAVMAKQGRAIYGVDMKIMGEDGTELPFGRSLGRPAGARPLDPEPLLQGRRRRPAADGWFPTGDVAKHRRRRLHADHRPQQGRHQVRRRMDRQHRPGEHRDGPPRPWPWPPALRPSTPSGTSARCWWW
jgi:acyl-CoA synthetase (AMP-forming)/AMP-acid ligase II